MAIVGAILIFIGVTLGLVSFVCAIVVLIHAFKTDTTQGILCLCVPFYALYYLFSKFDHPKKNMVTLGYLGGLILAIVFAVPGGCICTAQQLSENPEFRQGMEQFQEQIRQQQQLQQQRQQGGGGGGRSPK